MKTKEMIELFRKTTMPVVHVQHNSVRPGAKFLLPGTPGAELHENVKPLSHEKVFVKSFPNSFRGTGLDEYLKENNITKLVFAGMMTHMCIDTTVRAAFDLGYECVVASDCCATRDLFINGSAIRASDVHNAFMAALNGTFARVMESGEVMEQFKKIG